MSQISVYSHS